MVGNGGIRVFGIEYYMNLFTKKQVCRIECSPKNYQVRYPNDPRRIFQI
jgi:hypothetical protein